MTSSSRRLGLAAALVLAAGLAALPACGASGARSNGIAFMSDRESEQPEAEGLVGRLVKLDLWVMEAEGGDPVRLTSNEVAELYPSWSRDGAKIAFTGGRENLDIYVINADGSGRTRLTKGRAADIFSSWSPDGRRIVFTSDRGAKGGAGDVFVMNPDGSGVRRLTRTSANEGWPAWSPDGRTIAFVRRGTGKDRTRSSIYLIGADGDGERRLTGGGPYSDTGPAWSPDGTEIAFARFRFRGSRSEIWAVRRDGSGLRQVTDGGVGAGHTQPCWTADGARIVYAAPGSSGGDDPSDDEIWIVNAGGGDPEMLTSNDGIQDEFPACARG